MRLNSSAFNRFLNFMGQQFSWRKAYACPCISSSSGDALPTCTICQGRGRYWGDATPGIAAVEGREQAKKQADFGLWEAGDLMLSIPSDSPLYALGLYDKVAALNRSEPFSINVIPGYGNAIRFDILSVDSVTWVDAGVLVQGALPTLVNGELDWGANPPPSGVTYAITGRRVPEYFCYQDLPLDRPHHAGAALPRRVQLRRFDLFGV